MLIIVLWITYLRIYYRLWVFCSSPSFSAINPWKLNVFGVLFFWWVVRWVVRSFLALKDVTDPSDLTMFWIVQKSLNCFTHWITIILPFLIFLALYNSDSRNGSGILVWFASIIMIGVMGTLLTWISYQIPLILNNPIWNYILNFLLHTLLWILIIKLGDNKNKKTNANNF